MNTTEVQANKLGGTKKQALVAFGANLPAGSASPAASVSAAIDMLASRAGADLCVSRLWQTPAYPEGSGPPYVNAAVAFDWSGTAEALLALLHGVEDAFGRRRIARWEARRMDLDLIERSVRRRNARPIRAPITAIVSPSDAIVAHAATLDRHNPNVRHLDVDGSHLGMCVNPTVWRLVAETLIRRP